MKSCAKLHGVLAKQKAQKQVPVAINEREKGLKPWIWGGNSAYTELSFSADGVYKAQCDWSDPETLTEANHSTENKVSYLHRERHKCCMITSALKSIYRYHSKSLILIVTPKKNCLGCFSFVQNSFFSSKWIDAVHFYKWSDEMMYVITYVQYTRWRITTMLIILIDLIEDTKKRGL